MSQGTVLVVDDSASIRQVVAMTLKGAGYAVLEASNGQDALSKLTDQKIGLMITDINMPIMDGITFIKEVKKDPGRLRIAYLVRLPRGGDLPADCAAALTPTFSELAVIHPVAGSGGHLSIASPPP